MDEVNNFDVLKRMGEENLDIRLGTNVLNLKKVKAGTQVTVGIGGDIVGSVFVGDLKVCLVVFSKKQFDWVKKKIKPSESRLRRSPAETAAFSLQGVSLTQDEAARLHELVNQCTRPPKQHLWWTKNADLDALPEMKEATPEQLAGLDIERDENGIIKSVSVKPEKGKENG